MKQESKSWKYLGLLALALTAGAVRWESDRLEDRGLTGFIPVAVDEDTAPGCNRLDAAWLGQCTRPDVVLASQ